MHRIHRSWSAGRESRLVLSSTSRYHCYHSFLHAHVSVKRLPEFAHSGRIAPSLRKTFTKSCHDHLRSQDALPNQNDDKEYYNKEYEDNVRQYVDFQSFSSHDKKLVNEQHFTSDYNAVENHSDSQTSLNEMRHDDSASSGNFSFVPLNDEQFITNDCLWPLQASDLSAELLAPFDPSMKPGYPRSRRDEQMEQGSIQLSNARSALEKVWKPRKRFDKIDLSYYNPIRGERKGTVYIPPDLEPASLSPGFRVNTQARMRLDAFAKHIYHRVSSTDGISEQAALPLLTHPNLAPVKMNFDVILNLLSWTWILLGPPAVRLKRLVHWSRSKHGHVTPNVPQWLVFQLLRSNKINPGDLVDLLDLIKQQRGWWSSKMADGPMILVVRLLRHARYSHPACFSHIVELFMQFLDGRFAEQPGFEDARRRAHWCNRVLSLLALTVRSHPFKHVVIQQDAQLRLLQYMHDASPAISLNREGYRALAKVQLMHAKTDGERAWATVQAPTWPPWEQQHQMGVTSPPRQSLGNTSRTNLVLKRMKEDGYGSHSVDVATGILGGRDLDGSPTVQVRRLPWTIPSALAWRRGLDSMHFDKSIQIWIARVTATRTVREAWMGLCAYENAVGASKRAICVYHAMFEKLWAATLPAQSEGGPLPGDGKENFPEPELARDRVHVAEEPPSIEGLYERMTAQGLKPEGPLLRDLLLREDNLYRGLAYIQDSSMSAGLKEVLTKPMAHPPWVVAEAVNELGKDTRAAYVGLLARPHSDRNEPRPDFRDLSNTWIPGAEFAFRVLHHAKCSEFGAWTAYLAALSRHARPSGQLKRLSVTSAWKLTCDSYALEKRSFDASVLPYVLFTAWSVRTWEKWTWAGIGYEPLDVSMAFFMEAVSGVRDNATEAPHERWSRFVRKVHPTLFSVPTADNIQEMAFIMVAVQQESMTQDIIGLLHWAYEHRHPLATVSHFTKRNLAAFRVYLEGQWATLDPEFMDLGLEVKIASPDQVMEARGLCHCLGGWASDEDVGEYLESSHDMFARVKRKLKFDAQIA